MHLHLNVHNFQWQTRRELKQAFRPLALILWDSKPDQDSSALHRVLRAMGGLVTIPIQGQQASLGSRIIPKVLRMAIVLQINHDLGNRQQAIICHHPLSEKRFGPQSCRANIGRSA